MPKSKVAIISIGVLVVICLVSMAFPTINMIKSISSKIESSDEVAAELSAEEKKVEEQALDAISKTSEILGQKVVAITQDQASKNTIYTFESGGKFELPLNAQNTCQVGDKITSFDEAKNMLSCVDTSNANGTARSIYIPSNWLTGVIGGTVGTVASIALFNRFFGGNTYLRNNGYTSYYSNGQNGFANNRGDKYDFGTGSGGVTSSASSVSNPVNGNGSRVVGRTVINKKTSTTSDTTGKSGAGKATGSGTTGGFGSGGTTGTS